MRFGKWLTILATPVPGNETPILARMWHYARGMAFVATGKLDEARKERNILAVDAKTVPATVAADFNNPAQDAFGLALDVRDARAAEALGQQEEALLH